MNGGIIMSGIIEPENIVLRIENANLADRLRHKNQTILYLSNSLDREMKIRGRITSVLREVDTGQMTPELAISYMRMIVGDKR